ncbi:MAG: DUF4129 domain-containing protein [Magnetococcales bacterium]|nr:DUF4129 domain-containing protein [Magnetococcales bacterium]
MPPPVQPPRGEVAGPSWWLVIPVVALVMALLLLRPWWRVPEPPEVRWYRRFCRSMARRGTSRGPAEGPVDFAHRAARDHPSLGDAIAEITRLYVALRYGAVPPAGGVGELAARVRRISMRR